MYQLYETHVARWRQAPFEAGAALEKIREGRLYREQYPTFEDYCLKRWGPGNILET
jgi:hypothetical protein